MPRFQTAKILLVPTWIIALCAGLASAQVMPLTAAEASGWTRTATTHEVSVFLESLGDLPEGRRFRVETVARSMGGRPLQSIHVPSLGKNPLRVVILANIHGGEVEGKEAVQLLCREIASGEHTDLLEHLELHLVPVFNPDGNDAIDRGNRRDQNGPELGVGERSNGQGLDLNRDFLKAESPEVRALLRLVSKVDPHLFLDLHTTNGSYHGYHLTYAPCLSPNQDPFLDDFLHETYLPAVRRIALADHGIRVFDYGNFPSDGRRQDPDKGWWTYDHRPRFGTNYMGLRNRLSVLAEAYSYLPYRERVSVMRAFVLACLETLAAERAAVRALCGAADLRVMEGDHVPFGFATEHAETTIRAVLVGSVKSYDLPGGRGRRLAAVSESESRDVPCSVRFRSTKSVARPEAWAVVAPTAHVRRVLLLHDLEVEELLAPAQARCEAFTVEGLVRPRMRFQGHRLVTLEGSHGSSEEREIPAGSLIIRARQRLGRVAAQLLEGSSEDGLVTWNFFDDHLKRENDVVDGGLGYPVLRLLDLPAIGQTRRVVLEESGWQVEGALSPPPADQRGALRVQVRCADPGSLRPRGTPGPPSRREGRRLVYRVGDEVFDGIAGLDSALPRLRASLRGAALILDVGPQVREEELRAVAESGRKAGFDAIYLQRVPE